MRQIIDLKVWRLAIIIAAATPLLAEGATLAFGPGVVLVQNITPGAAKADIFDQGEFTFVIYNNDKDSGWYNLGVEKPTQTNEFGFEPIPDASWCKLDTTEVEVKGESKAKIRLSISVPDKPEYFNRKWLVHVICAPGKKLKDNASAVGLRVASRLLIETASKPEAEPKDGPAVALWPTLIQSSAVGGAFIDETVKIKNETDAERTYTTKHMNEMEKEKERHDRYFSRGFAPQITPAWITSDATFKLKPGEMKDLKVDIKVPEDAKKGKYEEILFVQDDKGSVNFLRVQLDVAPTTTAEKKP